MIGIGKTGLSQVAGVVLGLALVAVQGCGGSSAPAAGGQTGAPGASSSTAAGAQPPTISPAVRKRAKETFLTTCATCHGETGQGDGPGAAALEPKPRKFGDKAWQASVTDEHIEKVMVYGGAAAGKSAQMPAHPMLKDNAALRSAMREYVRSFGEGGDGK